MKKLLVLLGGMLLVFGVMGPANALPITGTYGGHDYALVPFTGTWEQASAAINAVAGEGWYFADITSEGEQAFIAGLLNSTPGFDSGSTVDLVWIGGWQNPNITDPGTAGLNWKWVVTGVSITDFYWMGGEPNDWGGDEGYLALDKRAGSDWLWNDAPNAGYSLVRGYVAERIDPVPEPATLLLLGSGLIGIGLLVRRYKKL